MTSGLTLDSYAHLLDGFFDRDYRFVDFEVAESRSRHVILRHDVDFDLDAASTMGELECGKGVRATYFVLVGSEFYNLQSPRALSALANLRKCGHSIGIHFDAGGASEVDQNGLVSRIEEECAVLEAIVGHPIKLVSLHRPSKRLLEIDLNIANRINVYSKRFFRDIGYCSDSRGRWSISKPLDHPAVQRGHALQLLIHPLWWVHSCGDNPGDKLRAFLDRRFRFLEREMSANSSIYHLEAG